MDSRASDCSSRNFGREIENSYETSMISLYYNISRCYLTFYATSWLSIKSQVLDLKALPIFSPLKISVNGYSLAPRGLG